MKSLQQFLTDDVKRTYGNTKTIAHVLRGNMPFYGKFIEDIFKRSMVITAYHQTDIQGLIGLAKLQGTKKQVSVFRGLQHILGKPAGDVALDGVETEGGAVAILKGRIVNHADIDIFTNTDQHGYRWVNLDEVNDASLETHAVYDGDGDGETFDDLHNTLRELRQHVKYLFYAALIKDPVWDEPKRIWEKNMQRKFPENPTAEQAWTLIDALAQADPGNFTDNTKMNQYEPRAIERLEKNSKVRAVMVKHYIEAWKKTFAQEPRFKKYVESIFIRGATKEGKAYGAVGESVMDQFHIVAAVVSKSYLWLETQERQAELVHLLPKAILASDEDLEYKLQTLLDKNSIRL